MKHLRLEVKNKYLSGREQALRRDLVEYLNLKVDRVEVVSLFWLELPQGELPAQAQQVFVDPLLQELVTVSAVPGPTFAFAVEVSFRPGVTDNTARSAEEALHLLGLREVRAATGTLYLIHGNCTHQEVERAVRDFLANPLIHKIRIYPSEEWRKGERDEQGPFCYTMIKDSKASPKNAGGPVEVIAVQQGQAGEEALLKMSEERGWAFNCQEIRHLLEHYSQASVKEARLAVHLPAAPTDVEIEIIAQTWSEHCKHKIFQAHIDYEETAKVGPALGNKKIKGLFPTYIRGATQRVIKERGIEWAVSLFTDNAGMVRFDRQLDLCIKVETHNSPSALDPYGGALTGILGVNRDILGCGLGARPIANTDIFCLCPPSWPSPAERQQLPIGVKHPRQILEGVHRGIADGGNKSGIPTVNGSLVFDRDFAGKPLIFCGTVGVIPHKVNGRDSFEKALAVGDLVVMVGGAIGKDGIHGATLSSLEMTEATPSSMVQIGDPLTQKRVLDFILEARDQGLYSAITDNGAGGLSSSVGEMAQLSGGARLDLSRCPLKFPDLSPYEIMVSESQERMTLAVPPSRQEAFLDLARRRGVTASVIGEFTQSGFLEVFYREERVAHLSLEFLHRSLPPMELKALWSGVAPARTIPGLLKKEQRIYLEGRDTEDRAIFAEALLQLLRSENICSKESLVRQYDHEVQAATLVKPFVGPQGKGPSDAAVLALAPHGGEEKRGVAIGHGLCPKLSAWDTYLMAQMAVDEAIRNVVAVGGDPAKLCLVDNFCWPDPVASAANPEGAFKLAQLVRACEGLYDGCRDFGAPLVSGKDSMKNDFKGKFSDGREVKISVPPTLLVTAMADVSDTLHTATMDFKKAGDLIFLLGANDPDSGLLGSELSALYTLAASPRYKAPPTIDLKENSELYGKVHQGHGKDLFRSVHDVSDGGLLVALVECMIGGERGAKLELEEADPWCWAFHEGGGRLVVSVAPEKRQELERLMQGSSYTYLGRVEEEKALVMPLAKKTLYVSLRDMERAWRRSW